MAGRRPLYLMTIEPSSIALSPLSLWIECCLRSKSDIPQSVLEHGNRIAYALYTRLGIFKRKGIRQTVTCLECEEPHACEVLRDEQGRFSYICLSNGSIQVGVDDVTVFSFDRDALLDALAAGAHLKPANIKSYASERLIFLGLVSKQQLPEFTLAYADGLEDENVFAGVIEALTQRFPKGAGLIATPSRINVNVSLPKAYKFAKLEDLFVGAAEALVLNEVTASLSLGNFRQNPGKAGRPSEAAITYEIWGRLYTKHDWPSNRGDQATVILAEWPVCMSEKPRPKTIEHHIRDFEKRIADDIREPSP